MNIPKPDAIFKIVFVGDSGTGKSSLLRSMNGEPFQDNFVATIGVDFCCFERKVAGKLIKLQIWDTAGQDRFEAIVQSYFRGAMGVYYVFDSTNEESLNRVSRWVRMFRQTNHTKVVGFLVANKIDIEASFDFHKKAESICQEHALQLVEVSAKTRQNVDELVTKMILQMGKIHGFGTDKMPFQGDDSVLALDAGDKTKTKSCC